MSYHRQIIERSDRRRLCLYSKEYRSYRQFEGLPAIDSAPSHLRRHPLTGDWIGVASARQWRTFLPNQAECPFCAMYDGGPMTDIPVDDYEVAIFTNRFSALSPLPDMPPDLSVATAPGLGICEVISYSSTHDASLATIGTERIGLLIEAIGAEASDLFAVEGIQYVLPFENRGRENGVTVDHPHGQIYALSNIPERITRQAEVFRFGNPLMDAMTGMNKKLVISNNDHGVAFVPEWARYPFEICVVPYRRVASPKEMSSIEIEGYAALLDEAAKKLDAVFEVPMPLTMGWHLAPLGYEDVFHFHCVFQPLKRSKTKMKYLAAIEQITSLFLLDVPPEYAAAILNGLAHPDD